MCFIMVLCSSWSGKLIRKGMRTNVDSWAIKLPRNGKVGGASASRSEKRHSERRLRGGAVRDWKEGGGEKMDCSRVSLLKDVRRDHLRENRG